MVLFSPLISPLFFSLKFSHPPCVSHFPLFPPTESAYTILRTQEQLGYIVWATAFVVDGVRGVRVTIQSPVADPLYLENVSNETKIISFFNEKEVFDNES